MLANNLKEVFLNTTRLNKQLLALTLDFLLLLFSSFIAISISLPSVNIFTSEIIFRVLWAPIIAVIFLAFLGIYKSVVRYIELSTLYSLFWCITLVAMINFLLIAFLANYLTLFFPVLSLFQIEINPETWTIGYLCSLVLIIGSRILANRFFTDETGEKRVVIYGAGSAGIQLAQALRVSTEMKPIAFVDDNESLQGRFLGGVQIINPSNLKDLINKKDIDEVLIAMPSQSKTSLRSILNEVEEYPVKVRILPGVAELAQGKIGISELKEVDIEDLLGREEVLADKRLIERHVKQKIVMVTGAGGSIGSEISRQVIKNNPKLLIIFDLNEFSLYSIRQELLDMKKEIRIESILGNVRDKNRVKQVCKTFGVQTIYHAAAYKHVPLVEENPFEAVSNNIFGTLNCALGSIESNVETFVLISTDKAVHPTNIMGATKRFSELILQSLSDQKEVKESTKISIVRFGNVLGSSGSAIPLFQKQIREGGPLTVTDPEVIRYFMSLSEAAELVIQAGSMGEGGDLFVLEMGEPVRILELAERLIRLSGMEVKSESNPDGDIEIIFTGLRPGEKLYEELLIGDDVKKTEHQQIYKANEDFIPWKDLQEFISLLKEAETSSDNLKLTDIFKQTVVGYKPEGEIVDVIYLENKNSTFKN